MQITVTGYICPCSMRILGPVANTETDMFVSRVSKYRKKAGPGMALGGGREQVSTSYAAFHAWTSVVDLTHHLLRTCTRIEISV